jgi:hypothetical protein
MTAKCPGQDFRKLTAESCVCAQCGSKVEIFSDEMRVRCHRCGASVNRQQTPSCAEWCSAARQCLGEERWQILKTQEEKDVTNGDS